MFENAKLLHRTSLENGSKASPILDIYVTAFFDTAILQTILLSHPRLKRKERIF